ncbi:cytochrome P450 [Lipomyces oligophaga]|uniref:cytochrome P450 n=1 Tax=Lipomyces oligophaga TaxID=45792 RepID=UPI0034D01F59
MPKVPDAHLLFGNFYDYGAKNYYEHALDMKKKYPDLDICRFQGLFGSDVVTCLSAEAHSQVLQSLVYKLPKPDVALAFKEIIGNGVVFAEGETHVHMRKMLSPAFSYTYVKRFVPIFMEKTLKVMDLFQQNVESGKPVFQVAQLFSRLTLDAIGAAAFGVELHAIEDENNVLVRAYEAIENSGADALQFNLFALLPGWKYIPTEFNNNIRRSQKIFGAAVKSLIKERITQATERRARGEKLFGDGEDEEKQIGAGKTRDLLTILIDHDAELDYDVESQIMTFLFAGHETTAGSCSWALLTLAQHPEVQTKLREEIRAAFPNGPEDIQTAEQIESLRYLNNVTREIFRVNPPVLNALRQASEDIDICGTKIQKGTNVQLSMKAMNYDTKLWGPDADEFDPDRWNGRQADNAFAYLTFLQGPRSCIGRRFAEIEFKCILAGFVGRFEFGEAVPNQPIHRSFVVTVKPTDGLPLKVGIVDGW